MRLEKAPGGKAVLYNALVATLKRSSNELSSYAKKIFKIDDHCGIAIAGLVADARVIAKYMRTECINHRYVYDSPMQVGRLVLQLADKAQVGTQRAGSRPYGVGVLMTAQPRLASYTVRE